VIGAGAWGINWVRTLAALPDVELRWVCDLSEQTLQRVRQQFPQVKATPRVEDLLTDPTLDGVVIATVAPTHFDVARRALEAGKNVMVEKPMTLTTREAVALTELAQGQRVLMVGHLLEYHPAVLYIKKLIDSGELGEVYYLYSQRLNYGTVRKDENAWWSLAPHDISVACRLLGQWPTSVQCRGQNIVGPAVADVVFATLEFPGGRLAHFHVSWLDPHKTRKLTVVGSRKMVVFDDTLTGSKVTVADKQFQLNPGKDGAAWITLRQGDVLLPKIDATEPLVREARHFVECIQQKIKPISDGESGTMVVAVLEHGQRSLETGKPVAIPPLGSPQLRQPLAA
jgi:predicted dehydrogenase